MKANRRLAVIIAMLAVFAAFAAAACSGGGDDDDAADPTPTPIELGAPSAWEGVRVTPPLEKPDVTLTDTSGQPYNIREETEGYVTLLYLGYTHCPDICPTHMVDIATVLKGLEPDVAAKVKVVFVTTDPERDTPEALRAWLDLFDKNFIGLTGPEDVLQDVERNLGMQPAAKVDLGGGNYAVNHAAYVMAYGTDNRSNLVYPSGITQDAYAHDIEKLVKEGWSEK